MLWFFMGYFLLCRALWNPLEGSRWIHNICRFILEITFSIVSILFCVGDNYSFFSYATLVKLAVLVKALSCLLNSIYAYAANWYLHWAIITAKNVIMLNLIHLFSPILLSLSIHIKVEYVGLRRPWLTCANRGLERLVLNPPNPLCSVTDCHL